MALSAAKVFNKLTVRNFSPDLFCVGCKEGQRNWTVMDVVKPEDVSQAFARMKGDPFEVKVACARCGAIALLLIDSATLT